MGNYSEVILVQNSIQRGDRVTVLEPIYQGHGGFDFGNFDELDDGAVLTVTSAWSGDGYISVTDGFMGHGQVSRYSVYPSDLTTETCHPQGGYTYGLTVPAPPGELLMGVDL